MENKNNSHEIHKIRLNLKAEGLKDLNIDSNVDLCNGSNLSSNNIPNSISNIDPNYITGFCDGEACFHLSIRKNNRYSIGYYVNPVFCITLHNKDLDLLKLIKEFFDGIGLIRNQTKDLIEFKVLSIKDLNVIINHFDKYPLMSKKRVDYLLFKEALSLIKNKQHLNLLGFNEIISIRAGMNKGLPESLRKDFSNIISRSVPLYNLPDKLNPNWVSGFTEAEGCFFVKYIKKDNDKYQFILGLQITQSIRDNLLLKKLIYFFNCGRLEINRKIYNNYVVTRFSNIIEIIIPFFDKYSIIGSKHQDYEKWKFISKLIDTKVHLTEEGIREIFLIKSKMNTSKS